MDLFQQIFEGKDVLFIVAHADDEVIFFGQILVALMMVAKSVRICIMAPIREEYFRKVCAVLGYEGHMYDMGYYGGDPFQYEEGILTKMSAKISEIIGQFKPDAVVTHGQFTDYPHFHYYHRLMHYATIKAIPAHIKLISRIFANGDFRCVYKKKVLRLLQIYPENVYKKYFQFIREPTEFMVIQ